MNSKIKIGFLIVLVLMIIFIINVVDSKDTEKQYCEKHLDKCNCTEEKVLYKIELRIDELYHSETYIINKTCGRL